MDGGDSIKIFHVIYLGCILSKVTTQQFDPDPSAAAYSALQSSLRSHYSVCSKPHPGSAAALKDTKSIVTQQQCSCDPLGWDALDNAAWP